MKEKEYYFIRINMLTFDLYISRQFQTKSRDKLIFTVGHSTYWLESLRSSGRARWWRMSHHTTLSRASTHIVTLVKKKKRRQRSKVFFLCLPSTLSSFLPRCLLGISLSSSLLSRLTRKYPRSLQDGSTIFSRFFRSLLLVITSSIFSRYTCFLSSGVSSLFAFASCSFCIHCS